MVLHVCWEKTLFGLLYQGPKHNLFKKTLAKLPGHARVSYGELFYIYTPGNLGSFNYVHCPVTQTTRTHIGLWTGHTEQMVFTVKGGSVVDFSRKFEGTPLSMPLRELLAQKSDDEILIGKLD
jgi:hypothetical protein